MPSALTKLLAADIAAILVAAGKGTLGTNLFRNHEPDAPDDCTTVYDLPGARSTDGDALIEAPVQILCRSLTQTTAQSAAFAIHEQFLDIAMTFWPKTTVETHIFSARPNAGELPEYLGQDAKGRHAFRLGLTVHARRLQS